MHRIDNSTAVPVLPAAAVPGTPGYFTEGDPVGGVPATILDRDWFNAVQEEPIELLALAGINPVKGTHTQLRDAVRRLAAAGKATLSADTSLTADQAGVVKASAAGGDVTLTLPAANAAGGAPLRYTIVRTDTSSNALLAAAAGSDTIEGAASVAVGVRQRVTLVSDGVSAWYVAGHGALYGGTGYELLPGGRMRQWGNGNTSAGGATITFPVSFRAAPDLVLLSERGSSSWIPGSNWSVYGSQSQVAGGMFVNSITYNGSAFVYGSGAFSWEAWGAA